VRSLKGLHPVRKSPFEFLIDFTRLAKAALVRVVNFAVPVYRNAKSYIRLVFSFAETFFLGYWHALLVHKNGTAPDTLVIAHAVSNNASDPERFLAQFATEILKSPDCKDIDLLLLANDAQPVTTYSALARMFGRRLNLQVFSNGPVLADVGKTVTDTPVLPGSGGRTDARAFNQILLSEKATGYLRPPLLSKNMAREYLKSIDPTGRFCAVSFPADGRPMDAKSVLADVAKRHPDWRFVVLNDSIAFGDLPHQLPPEVLVPARAGFDFLTRLCLAIETDAYIGATDVFGVTAYLAQRPAHLLEGRDLPVKIVTAPPKPRWMLEDPYRVPADEIERLATDLFGANA
jgi:hypothetical protein